MATPTAREMIRQEYGSGKNFMTPRVIRVGKVGRYRAFELSSGRGFANETIYGVSVVDFDPDTRETRRRTDLMAGCFTTLSKAEYHIEQLKLDYQEGL